MVNHKRVTILLILLIVLGVAISTKSLAFSYNEGQDEGTYTQVRVKVYLDELSGSASSEHNLYVKSFGGHIISAHFVLITDLHKKVDIFIPTQSGVWYTRTLSDQNTYTATAKSYTLIEDEATIDAYAQAMVP